MTELLVYENHDIFLRHATRAQVSGDLDTLEKFLDFVSSRIAVLHGNLAAAGHYRFVYSIDGRPLWDVSQCREAGVVVVSCTPGFLPRKVSCSAAVNSSAEVTTPPAAFSLSSSNIWNTHHKSQADRNSGFTMVDDAGTSVPFSRDDEHCISENNESIFIQDSFPVVPPLPRFPDPTCQSESPMSHADMCDAVQTLIARKLLGRPFILDDILFKKELQPLILSSFDPKMLHISEKPVHMVIEGPPQSGVSTTLAYAFYLAVTAKSDRFRNCLYLPLNFELLFDSSTASSKNDSRRDDALLLPSFFWFTVARHVVDCAVSQRPELRERSAAIAEAAERLAEEARGPRGPSRHSGLRGLRGGECGDGAPRGLAADRLARLIGRPAEEQWNGFAAAVAETMRAVEAAPRDEGLRDMFIEILFSGFVAQIASAFRFSGVVYIIDGVRRLASVLRHRVRRPSGDAGALLRCLMSHPSAHVFVGIDSLLLPNYAVIPPHAQRVTLLHAVPSETLVSRYGYPREIRCGSTRFPLEMLLGVPGYVQVLNTLLREDDVLLRRDKPYSLRVDNEEVFSALQDLAATLKLDEIV